MIVATVFLSSCYGGFGLSFEDHPCASCDDCQTCTVVTGGVARCEATPRVSQACGTDANIRWIDSCGGPGGVVTACAHGASCQTDGGGRPYCQCVQGWSGDSCEICSGGTVSNEGMCIPCPSGTFDHDADPTSACVAATVCAPSEYERAAPTPTSDRQCAALTTCSHAQYERLPPTPTSDRVCEDVTVCDDTQFQSALPTATSDRVCVRLTTCTTSQFEAVPPTTSSDRVCAPLTECAPSEFELSPPSATSDRVCGAPTECTEDMYELEAPTATSDRQCRALTVCEPGQYVLQQPTATSDRVCATCPAGTFTDETNRASCAAWDVCTGETYERTPPVAFRDRECAPISVCTASEYEVAPPTTTSDRQCLQATICEPGELETAPPTATTDRTCAECPGETYSTVTNAAGCEPWSNCSPGQRVSVQPNAIRDRHCAPCAEGAYSTIANTSTCTPWTECGPGDMEEQPGSTTSDRTCRWWIRQFGTAAEDQALAVALDGAGNIFVAGRTQGDLEGQPNAGDADAFVLKVSSSDGSVTWARLIGTSGHDQALSLSIDSGGDILVAGATTGDLTGLGSHGGQDLFVAKLSGMDGSTIWLVQHGTANTDRADGVTLDSNDDVILTGVTSGPLLGRVHSGNHDIFVMKIAGLNGAFVWIEQLAWPASQSGIAVDTDGNDDIIVVGNGYGGAGTGTSLGAQDMLITKHRGTDGVMLWARNAGTDEDDSGLALAVDSNGDVLAAGWTWGYVDGRVGRNRAMDALVVKVDGTNGAIRWSQQIDSSNHAQDAARDIAVVNDRVIVTGSTRGTIGPQRYGIQDIFIAELQTTNGQLLEAEQFGSTGFDIAPYLALGPDGSAFISGSTEGSMDGLPRFGGLDLFLARLPR